MIVNLTLRERYSVAHQMVPSQGTFEDLIIGKDIKDKTEFIQEEINKFKIKTESQGNFSKTTWDEEHPEAKSEFPIEFTELEFNMVKNSLKEKSKAKQLHIDYVDLYRKFDKDFK